MSAALARLRDVLAYVPDEPPADPEQEARRRLVALEAAAIDLVAAIDGALVLRPCHLSGMHGRHEPGCLCREQLTKLGDGLLAALEVEPAELPRALHENCGWCHTIPGQEEYRAGLRRLWDWAGVPITPELAKAADDAPRPDDPARVLAHVLTVRPVSTEGWRNQFRMGSHHDHFEEAAPKALRRGDRFSRAVGVLVEQGKLEHRFIDNTGHVRPTPAVVDPFRTEGSGW